MDQPVTVVVTHKIKPGSEEEFGLWRAKISSEVTTHKGYLGHLEFPPIEADPTTRHFAFRFASMADLQSFWSSETYRRLRQELDGLVSEPSRFLHQTGLEHFFVEPDGPPGPPKYKMVVVVFLALFPLVSIIPPNLRPLLEQMLPGWMVPPIVNLVVILLMVYLVMPFMSWLLGRWLRPRNAASPSRSSAKASEASVGDKADD